MVDGWMIPCKIKLFAGKNGVHGKHSPPLTLCLWWAVLNESCIHSPVQGKNVGVITQSYKKINLILGIDPEVTTNVSHYKGKNRIIHQWTNPWCPLTVNNVCSASP